MRISASEIIGAVSYVSALLLTHGTIYTIRVLDSTSAKILYML
jgi:hypothetical protein